MRSIRHSPPELAAFVGRAEELAALDRLAVPGRLLTLVGPGGCGKTRLALRLAAGHRRDDPDDACWIGLEDLSHPDDVAGHLLAALEVTDVRELRDRRLLIVLDNCEHVLDGAAAVVAAVLGAGSGVRVLATSRTPLGVPGERTWPVPPLSLPDALALFLARAEHPVGQDQRAAARRICDRLDRLPLALELAAAWTATLTPAQIAGSLTDPYALLDGGHRTAPFRQRTLAESMRWSHDLLGAGERLLFRRLCVFEPGFDAGALPAAAAGDLDEPAALHALRGLISASLVVADPTGPAARYRMLATVRDYGLARLDEAGETVAARDAHLERQLATLTGLAPLLDTDREAWRSRIAADYPNLRAATEWGLSRDDPAGGRRLAAGLAWLWHDEQHGREGLRLMRRAVERGRDERGRDERTPLQAQCLVGLAMVETTAEPGGPSYQSVRAALDLAEEVGAPAASRLARSITAVGLLPLDLDRAREQALRARAEADAAGDVFVAGASAALLGLLHLMRDEHHAAADLLAPAADALQALGDRGVASSALTWLALATACLGHLDRAAGLAARAVTTATPLREIHRVGLARAALAEIQVRQGRLAAAAATLAPLDPLTSGADAVFVPGWGRVHALVALAGDEVAEALDWLDREQAWGAPPIPATQLTRAEALRRAGDLGAATEILAALQTSPLPAIRAGVLTQQAAVLATGGEAALRLQHEALRVRAAHDLVLDCVDSLEAIAALLADRNLAGVLAGAAARARDEAGYHGGAARPEERYPVEAVEKGRTTGLGDAAALAQRARGPRGRPASGWDSLTPTERSVVALAVQGLTNPDIATRLYIGRGTVKTHLAHVYAKLGVANRTELARLAAARPVSGPGSGEGVSR
ncbi:LuxR family transcriptional regulator [Actinoplanes ianthinogenes]|uniref:LuxR family transcriptional regulator n=1 Tax=Actinoplanes ianthinogenes TaxID=122358 RepID=A0ABM7LPN8_9ACTN|nr:LuxR C-terminal-related transcriptional regulator [Actinoplanes ianthinogenes]BCJ41202.1 LuxR family transcriptional regulator [Actinoplanes ianthinogenes]GGR22232.1 LuxR family transcriptional regulator [Actinoplanes ianthinogenes]